MTARRLLFGSDFALTPSWSNFAVGFDKFFNDVAMLERRISDNESYPPHNLKKIGDQTYELELAVAGFSEDDIQVDVEKQLLTIRGEKTDKDTQNEYLYRGVGTRAFTKTLALAETIEVRDAVLEHGMLKIRLENVIPEKDKPHRIAISTPKQLKQ